MLARATTGELILIAFLACMLVLVLTALAAYALPGVLARRRAGSARRDYPAISFTIVESPADEDEMEWTMSGGIDV